VTFNFDKAGSVRDSSEGRERNGCDGNDQSRIDIGGTFTDLWLQTRIAGSGRSKSCHTDDLPWSERLSCPRLLEKRRLTLGLLAVVIHATTLASNALLTGNLPKAALVTPRAFETFSRSGARQT